MANLFGTLNISKKGMMAQSFAINTTSHNISNADTPGFSRQRVHMQASSPYTYSGIGQLGTGVDVVGIERIRDEFLDAQICYEVSINGRYEASQTVLEQVEMIFLEPSDTGLNEYMTAMWDSWEELGNYPEKSNGSTFVAGTSKTFADELNRMSLQLDTLKLDTISNIEGKTYDANQLIHEIQELSDQIYKLSTKDLSANDLMDRRGLMIEKLSAIVNVNVDYDEFSRVKITEADTGSNIVLLGFNTQEPVTNEMSTIRGVTDLGAGVQEITVVRGGDISKTYTFTVSGKDLSDGDIVYADPAEWEAYDAGGTPSPPDPVLTKAHLREGELAGNKAAIEKIDEYHTELDQLAFTIAESVNLVHGGGANNIDFFTTSDSAATINAANIQVNTNILDDVNLINKGVDGNSGDGDASRAWAVAQLREVSLQLDHSNFETYLTARYDAGTMEVTPDPSGTSFQGYYKDVILKIGIDSKQAEDGVESQTTLLLQLGERRESISGVSIDEEVANLVQFQNSYQANARVITTLTEMLDTLINRMGL